ncbi:MAG: hypothetical protein V1901_04130 [Patescibacteria group bacterium]
MTLEELKLKLIGKKIQSKVLGNVQIFDVAFENYKSIVIYVQKDNKINKLFVSNENIEQLIERVK